MLNRIIIREDIWQQSIWCSADAKKIVCLKEPSGYSSGNERYRGYLAVCEKYGLKEQSVDCTYVYEEGIRAVGKMLEQYPDVDGVIAGNDMIAMAVYKELTRMGKKNSAGGPTDRI